MESLKPMSTKAVQTHVVNLHSNFQLNPDTMYLVCEQKSSSMLELHKFLRVKSAHKPESGLLEDLWGKEVNEVALLVSERLVNVPIELAPPLYKGLFEEVMWATEDEVGATSFSNFHLT